MKFFTSFFGGRIYAEALNISAIVLIVLGARGILNSDWNLLLAIAAAILLFVLAVATLARSQFRRKGHLPGYVLLFVENTLNGAGVLIAFILLWTDSAELELIDYACWLVAEVLDVANMLFNLALSRRPSVRNAKAGRGYAKVLSGLGVLKVGALLIWIILSRAGVSETVTDVSISVLAGFVAFALGVSIFRRFSAYANESKVFDSSAADDELEMGSVESSLTVSGNVS